ncbi:MAG: hypothetical protein COT16_01410 [Elusimicrobia bacterium CG08_land_8_20_14_0_20_44_26]|nr:MAG: hypothetical protein COT16_01410 [Elusimicrobia bacterium CG08_land_8_20_14_0_20_44_26]
MNVDRIKKVFGLLRREKISAAGTCDESDIFYFTNIKAGGSFLLFAKGAVQLFVNSLYPLKHPWIKPEASMKKMKVSVLAVEPEKTTLAALKRIRKNFGCGIREEHNLFSKVRAVKAKEEIEKIARAQKMAKRIMRGLIFKPGTSEDDCRRQICVMSHRYADGPSFEPIVAFSKNSAFPHHTAGGAKYSADMSVLIDMGVKIDGYCSDLTRIKGLSNIKNPLKRAFETLRQARKIALGNIHPGSRIGALDGFIREFLSKAGFEKNILHSSGHGIGLDVHEWPAITISEKGKFEKGMVFALEPGLYFEGLGGVREENVYVLEDKPKELA